MMLLLNTELDKKRSLCYNTIRNMVNENIRKLTLELINYAVFDAEFKVDISALDEKTVARAFMFARSHDIAQIIVYAFDKLGIKGDGKIFAEMRNELFTSVMRVEATEFLTRKTGEIFAENGIDHIMLKGAVLRGLYKQNFMRTSHDVDVLVRESQLDQAVKAAKDALQLKEVIHTPHDVVLMSEQIGYLEVHYTLVEDQLMSKAHKTLESVWDHCEHIGHEYVMSKEFFIFYHIVHMAKHVITGGCGIKPFIDLKLLLDNGYDNGKLEELLIKGGVKKFFDSAVRLVGYWFSDGETDAALENFESYIVNAGTFGSTKNMVAVDRIKRGSRFKYIIRRIFLPYNELKGYYPALEGKRWLTPFYQVKRWMLMIKRKRLGKKVKELKASGNVTAEDIEKTSRLLDDLGLI